MNFRDELFNLLEKKTIENKDNNVNFVSGSTRMLMDIQHILFCATAGVIRVGKLNRKDTEEFIDHLNEQLKTIVLEVHDQANK